MDSKGRISALAAILSVAAPPAFAQQETAAATSTAATGPEAAESSAKGGAEEQIVVVGSRTRSRSAVDTPVPVDVFDRRAVEQSLTTGELGQALQNLAPSINMPRVSASGTSDAIRSIQLRGLAPDEVLVLVNGKRWHTNAVLDQEGLFPGTVPVDLNALPPGAIERIEILRDGAGAQYGSDAVAGVVNIVLKKSQGGEVSAGYGQFHTKFAPTHSTINDGQNRQVGAAYGLGFGDGGYLRIGADFQSRNNTNRAGPASDFSETSSPPDLALVGNVLYRSGDPDVKNLNLFYNGAIGLPFGVEAYSFSTFNTRASEGAAFFRWPGDVENVPAVYPNGFRPVTTGDSNDWGFVAGLRGEASEWAWDLSLRNGYNRFSFGVRNSLNASLGAASPQSFHLNDFRSAQTSLNLDVSRSFRVDPIAGPLVLAFGAEGERDAYRTTPGDPASYAAGTGSGPPGAQAGPGLRPQEAVSATRNLAAVYADVSADLTRQLLLGLSGRFSAHEGFDSALTGKASARYKLTSDLQLRASISNNFRAPALAQTSFRRNSLDFNAAGNGLVNTALLPGNDAVAALFGARQLQPERSVNLSGGAALRLLGSLVLTADVYQIRIKDRIVRSSDLNSDPVQAKLVGSGITDYQALSFLTNAIDSTTRGADLVVNDDLSLAGGRLSLSAAFNYNRTAFDGLRDQPAQLAAIDPALRLFNPRDVYTLQHGSPDTKLIATVSWAGDALGGLVRLTRFGTLGVGTFDSTAPSIEGAFVQSYKANWSIDAEVRYTFVKLVTVAVGGNNLFDRYPDRQLSGTNLGGSLPYNYIAPIGFNGGYYYARASARF